jgi:hypothetical protein
MQNVESSDSSLSSSGQKGGSLHYFPAYSQDAMRREIKRLVSSRGLIRAGLSLLEQAGHNAFAYAYYTLVRPKFSFRKRTLHYYGGLAPFRVAKSPIPLLQRLANIFSKMDTERSLEIPIALEFVNLAPPGQLLEIGNVLGYYASVPVHTVVDRYEMIPGVLNLDAETIDLGRRFEFIVSVSTVEHIGFDEPVIDPRKAVRTVLGLRNLLNDDGHLLLSIPLGYNPEIDHCFLSGGFSDFDVTIFGSRAGSLDWVENSLPVSDGSDRRIMILEFPRKLRS